MHMPFALQNPWWLCLLPLALLPFIARGQNTLVYSSLAILPHDWLSQVVDVLLKLLAVLVIVAICLGMAGLYKPAERVERLGRGAQAVILFDTSTSMDTPYSGGESSRLARYMAWGRYESKGQVARKLIGKFVAQRPQDLFSIFSFSRNPIPIMPLTNNQTVIQAAIKAGTYERGLGTTDLGGGLVQALSFFENKPFKGSRMVMLVSDGAANLSEKVKQQIANLLKKHRVTLYWLYLRDAESKGLTAEVDAQLVAATAPEQLVNRFFEEVGTPYRAFAADEPKALEQAIAEVNTLQNLPIRYATTLPKQDLSNRCYAVALIALLLLLVAKFSEVRRWQ